MVSWDQREVIAEREWWTQTNAQTGPGRWRNGLLKLENSDAMMISMERVSGQRQGLMASCGL